MYTRVQTPPAPLNKNNMIENIKEYDNEEEFRKVMLMFKWGFYLAGTITIGILIKLFLIIK